MLVHCRVTPQHEICQYPFIHLVGERHCESTQVSCPRTQYNVPGHGFNPDRSESGSVTMRPPCLHQLNSPWLQEDTCNIMYLNNEERCEDMNDDRIFIHKTITAVKLKPEKKFRLSLSFHFLVRLDLSLLVLHIIVNLLNTAFLLTKSLQRRCYFGTEPSIDQVFDVAILDCCWLGHSAGGNGWVGRVLLSPRPFFHLSHTFSANCPSPQTSRYQIQDGGLIQKCALTWQ